MKTAFPKGITHVGTFPSFMRGEGAVMEQRINEAFQVSRARGRAMPLPTCSVNLALKAA